MECRRNYCHRTPAPPSPWRIRNTTDADPPEFRFRAHRVSMCVCTRVVNRLVCACVCDAVQSAPAERVKGTVVRRANCNLEAPRIVFGCLSSGSHTHTHTVVCVEAQIARMPVRRSPKTLWQRAQAGPSRAEAVKCN